MPVLKWAIFYDDRKEPYTNIDGPFEDAPGDGVLGVIEADEDCGYVIYHKCDYYFELEDGSIGMTNDLGPLLRKLGIVKFGRWVGKPTWNESWSGMVDWARVRFPNKGGRSALEDG